MEVGASLADRLDDGVASLVVDLGGILFLLSICIYVVVVLEQKMMGKEEKGIESRHPSIYIQARRKGRWGGPCHFNVDFIYIYVVIMTIPALDQYLAIGQSYLLLMIMEK